MPDRVNGDPLRFRQVLQNIVVNAVKFTEVGLIEVAVQKLEGEGKTVTLLTEVTDTGVGVLPQSADSLFKPFTQLDNSPTKRFKGTGLGLSICKSLVELMGGTIGFRKNPGGVGTIFWFTVTMSEALINPPNHIVKSTLSVIESVASKNILLVEDNTVNQMVMVKTLAKLGFTNIDVADDGQQGVETFQNGNYDLILMDISMPVKDGCEATRDIRALGSKIPIIAMTANALEGDAERFMTAGMSDYIAKPVDRQLLVNLLAKWLNQEVGNSI